MTNISKASESDNEEPTKPVTPYVLKYGAADDFIKCEERVMRLQQLANTSSRLLKIAGNNKLSASA